MPDQFLSKRQERLFRLTVDELERLEYRGPLLQRGYAFRDYFRDDLPERKVPAAAFGQTPASYETACFGVLLSGHDGKRDGELVRDYRALGAPFHFEIEEDHVELWSAGRDDSSTQLIKQFSEQDLAKFIRSHEKSWAPKEVLRAKNISTSPVPLQLDFYDLGLITALEENIREKLDPLLRSALASAVAAHKAATGNEPDHHNLFRLTFRMLAGKVFYDNAIPEFLALGQDPGPAVVLRAVAQHYRLPNTRFLSDAAREAIYRNLWTVLDFRNLSIAVLAHIWATTLVTKDIRQALGIHGTRRVLAKYIVDRLSFHSFADHCDTDQLVVEPCCGSAPFLVAALQRIRDMLDPKLTPEERHTFFAHVLIGFERETFGVEIARLCLTLADFPNPNGWQVHEANVFDTPEMPLALQRARVVLCNPPFEDFPPDDPMRQNLRSPHKPVEALRIILDNLHQDGVLGLVLPRQFLDGTYYRDSRRQIAERFGNIEIVALPDVAFKPAQHEAILLLACTPRGSGVTTTICHRKVRKRDWNRFCHSHIVSGEDIAKKTVAAATESMAVIELADVWKSLDGFPMLDGLVSTISRGIEWNVKLRENGQETGNRAMLVRDNPEEGYNLGVPPLAKPRHCFECPPLKYLCMKPEYDRSNSFDRPWDLPKIIMNAKRKSRGPWRVAAFADTSGLVFYQTSVGIWINEPSELLVVAAILNGPVANAYIATREDSDITNETLRAIPVPRLHLAQTVEIKALVANYLDAVEAMHGRADQNWTDVSALLRRIDATVLLGYDLPPRIERKLLDYFRGFRRPTPFAFGEYFPADFRPCFSLAEYLDSDFALSSVQEVRKRYQPASADVRRSLKRAAEISDEE